MLGRRSGARGGPGPAEPDVARPVAAESAASSDAGRSEADLLQRVRERDETALAALYERYAGLVYAVALRVVGDRHLAEEVLQDTFFRCWDEVASFDPARGRLSAWLLGVARNRAIDFLRSRQHQARLRERDALAPADRLGSADALPDTEAPAGTPYRHRGPEPPLDPPHDDLVLLRETVSQAMDGLPLVQRQAIALAHFGGLTQTEISGLLGVPLGTVKTRIRDGMERLRRALRPLIDPDAPAPTGREG